MSPIELSWTAKKIPNEKKDEENVLYFLYSADSSLQKIEFMMFEKDVQTPLETQ